MVKMLLFDGIVFNLFLLTLSVINSVVISQNITSKSINITFDQFLSIGDKSPVKLKDIIDVNKQLRPLPDFCQLKIIGGVIGDLQFVPYQIHLVQKIQNVYSTLCGGALITFDYGVSAAHCFTDGPHYSKLYAITGTLQTFHNTIHVETKGYSGDEQYSRLKNVYIHSNFVRSTLKNDVAIIQVNQRFVKSNKVHPIRLHTNYRQVHLKRGTMCLISGYGRKYMNMSSKELRMVCVPLVSKTYCEKIFARKFLSESNFCAGARGKDSCLGDSGGPMACHGILVGIVSFGAICGVYPGVYTRVLSYTAGNSKIPKFMLEDEYKSIAKKFHKEMSNYVFSVTILSIVLQN